MLSSKQGCRTKVQATDFEEILTGTSKAQIAQIFTTSTFQGATARVTHISTTTSLTFWENYSKRHQ
jgi:hypothetical protein